MSKNTKLTTLSIVLIGLSIVNIIMGHFDSANSYIAASLIIVGLEAIA